MKLWDYKLPKNWKPTTDEGWIWYLERKINYGDFKGLKAGVVKKYFKRLRLDEGKRLMFEHYFENKQHFSRLKSLKKWKGVLVDSLDDLAANKTMALVERHAPKDAVDIYFLIVKKKFTPKHLLNLAHKKFGLQMYEDTFLSEALRAAKQLSEIRPMLNGTSREQEATLKKIQDYFGMISAEFLRQRLGE